jgi:hypothetical protein
LRLNTKQPLEVQDEMEFRLTKDRETSRFWTLKASDGSHGDADRRLKDTIFGNTQHIL